jgi:hypothetical protein
VTIEPTVGTAPGLGVPELMAEDPWQAMLSPGSILQFAALSTDDELDMGIAGTKIRSGQEHPISAFAAHTCAGLPDYQGGCGHLQEQISPMLAGRHFVAAPMPLRDPIDPPRVLWQVQVLEDATVLAFDGEVPGLPEDNLIMHAGSTYGVWVNEGAGSEAAFEIFTDRPVMLAAYVSNPAANGQGSAAMVQIAPSEVYFPTHMVLTPHGYDSDYLVVTRHADDTVFLDGEAVDPGAFFPIGVGNYEVAQLAVEPGLHRVNADEPLMVVATGHFEGDAYAYLGAWGTPVPDYPAPG